MTSLWRSQGHRNAWHDIRWLRKTVFNLRTVRGEGHRDVWSFLWWLKRNVWSTDSDDVKGHRTCGMTSLSRSQVIGTSGMTSGAWKGRPLICRMWWREGTHDGWTIRIMIRTKRTNHNQFVDLINSPGLSLDKNYLRRWSVPFSHTKLLNYRWLSNLQWTGSTAYIVQNGQSWLPSTLCLLTEAMITQTYRHKQNRAHVYKRENWSSTSKTLLLKDSSVRSIWTYLTVTVSPCYITNTNKHDSTTNKYYKHD